jgi:hypothetical protein
MLPFLVPLLGPIVNTVGTVIKKIIPDKDLAKKLESEISLKLLSQDSDEFKVHLQEAASIIRAEANSQSWLARNWRPMLMCLFGLIVFNNYVLYPYLKLFFAQAPVLEVPADMWGLLKIGIGGYVVGRSAEKVAAVYKDSKSK